MTTPSHAQHAPPQTSRWAVRFYAALHHALAAGVMASAMLALEHFHALDWLDAAMLHIAPPRSSSTTTAARADQPQLLLIDNTAYADSFALRSPLDRDKLGQVLGDALAAKPKVLLIDLQLEPSVGESPERPLDALLRTAQAQGTRVVLPLPATRTAALDLQAAAWMRSMCDAGVHFGLAQVRSHFGSVVRFDRDGAAMAQQSRPGDPPPNPLCAAVGLTSDLAAIWKMFEPASRSTSESAPLQPSTVRAVMQQALYWHPVSARQDLLRRSPPLIVLGGAYDERDSFLTNALDDAVPGAAVHAAAIASDNKVQSSHARGWALDLFLGTALGFLFEALWRWVNRLRPVSHALSPQLVLLAWVRTALGAAIWMLAVGIALLLMGWMGRLIEYGWWLNPGPVVLGMFLHALLLKQPHAHHPTNMREFTEHSPTWPLQAAAVATALGYLLLHALH